MKNLQDPDIDIWRDRSLHVLEHFGGFGDGTCGAFLVPAPDDAGRFLRVLASTHYGWEHVSVSLPHRCPTWEEMSFVKRMMFKPEEVVMQLHVAEDNHINVHNYCLHLWRPTEHVIPQPPRIFV